MAQPTYFPTGRDEWDLEIMRQMDDVTLARWCRVNADLRNLCDDEVFWKERSQLYRKKLLQFVDRYLSWREFYKNILYDTVYLLYTPFIYYRAFNDPTAVYAQFVDDLTHSGLTMEEIVTGTRPEGFEYDGLYEILLAFRGERITLKNRRKYTLFSFGREEELATKDINDYPVLLSNKPLLILDIFGDIIENRDLTSEVLVEVHRRMLKEQQSMRDAILEQQISTVILAKPGSRNAHLTLTPYGFSFIIYGGLGGPKSYYLIDLAKLSDSTGFVIYEMTFEDLDNPYVGGLAEPQFYQWLIQQKQARPLSEIFSL